MGGANGGGWLNSKAGQLLSGEIIKPQNALGFVQNNPWVVPAAAAAATMMTAGAASPLLATSLAGEGAAAAGGAAAGGAAGLGGEAALAGGAAAGGAAPTGLGMGALFGANAGADAGSLGAALGPSAAAAAPAAIPSGMTMAGGSGAASLFGMPNAGMPYNAAQAGASSGLFHMPSNSQLGRIGANLLNNAMQQPQQPMMQRPPSMSQANQMPVTQPQFVTNPPPGPPANTPPLPRAPGSPGTSPQQAVGGLADILRRLGTNYHG